MVSILWATKNVSNLSTVLISDSQSPESSKCSTSFVIQSKLVQKNKVDSTYNTFSQQSPVTTFLATDTSKVASSTLGNVEHI
jgi:hypothetical protein